MNLKKIIILIVLVAAAIEGYSQSQSLNLQSDTIRWNSSGFTDLISNVTVKAPCQFVTYPGRHIDWIQGNGNYITSLQATSVTSSWVNSGNNGSVTIALAADKLVGQIVITRTTKGVIATLTLSGGSSEIKNSYTISSFEKL